MPSSCLADLTFSYSIIHILVVSRILLVISCPGYEIYKYRLLFSRIRLLFRLLKALLFLSKFVPDFFIYLFFLFWHFWSSQRSFISLFPYQLCQFLLFGILSEDIAKLVSKLSSVTTANSMSQFSNSIFLFIYFFSMFCLSESKFVCLEPHHFNLALIPGTFRAIRDINSRLGH